MISRCHSALCTTLLCFATLLMQSGQSQAATKVAPEVVITTDPVIGDLPPDPTYGRIPWLSNKLGESRQNHWAQVEPDAALKQKLATYQRAQTYVHAAYVGAGFEPAGIETRNPAGVLTTFYVDFQNGFVNQANAFAGTVPINGATSVWYNHAGFNGRNHTDNLHTVGHEFFHRILSPIAERRRHWGREVPLERKWMNEGIPTAISQMALEGFDGTRIKSRVKPGDKQAARALGVFYLDYPLDLRRAYPQPTTNLWFESTGSDSTADTLSYATASFWRHVAQSSGGIKWFKTLMDRPRPAGDTPGDWVDWVEDGIQKGDAFANLAEAYNSYVSWIIDYPYRNETSESGYFAWGKWQSTLFHEGCPVVEVFAGRGAVPVSASIRPLSSQCLRVKVNGVPEKLGIVQITLANATDAHCRDLNVVAGGMTTILQSPVLEDDGTCSWHWHYPYRPVNEKAKGEQVFVITNVRPDSPSKTQYVRNLQFLVKAPGVAVQASGNVTATTAASVTAEKKLPVPKKASQKAEVLPVSSSPDIESPEPYRGSGCDALTRQIGPCGPYTEIKLGFGELAEYAIETGLSKIGVAGGDLTSINELVAQVSGGAFMGKATQSIDAAITLKFPRIEPGFTGSFSDAMISLGVGQGDFSATLESIDPKYIRKGINFECPDVGAIYRYNGKVSIESYTASGITGSFSADFHQPPSEGCPVPLKVATVSGRFSTAPAADEVQEAYQDRAAGQERFNALLIHKFYAMVPPALGFGPGRATTWAMFSKGLLGGATDNTGLGGGGSAGVLAPPAAEPGCACDCKEMLSKPTREGCAKQCSTEFSLMGLSCAMEGERDKGNTPNEANRRIEQCPKTCAEYRSQPVGELCETAMYLIYAKCGSGDVTAAEIERYLDILVAPFPEPTRSEQRVVMKQQVLAMDAETRNLLVRTTLEAQQQ